MKLTDVLDTLSLGSVMQQLAAQIREYAKDSGTACSLPNCDALTLGVRCDKCGRRMCTSHTYWKLTLTPPKPTPQCPYCVLTCHPDLFGDGVSDGDEG